MMSPGDIVPVDALSAYFHVPFCRRRCSYCGFYSTAGGSVTRMRETVVRTLGTYSFFMHALEAPEIDTVYIGGGTPSVLDAGSLELLLKGISSSMKHSPEEWTVEANPESAGQTFLSLCEEYGVDRLSVGVQSFDVSLRGVLGRLECEEGLEKRLETLRNRWKGRLNIDLICGIPGQSVEQAVSDVRQAASCECDHISLYSLGIEKGTELAKRIDDGSFRLPDRDTAEEAWFSAAETLESLGYRRYEISNFALDGCRSLHNLAYWRMKPYAGCGPSAVSTLPCRDGPVRLTVERDGTLTRENLSSREFLLDYLLMGLRTVDGIPEETLRDIFGPGILDPFESLIESWTGRGFAARTNGCLHMTGSGLPVLDTFLREAALIIEEIPVNSVFWPLPGKPGFY